MHPSNNLGIFVIGGPGCGKTSFCKVLARYLMVKGESAVHFLNFDPGNENKIEGLDIEFDIRSLWNLQVGLVPFKHVGLL